MAVGEPFLAAFLQNDSPYPSPCMAGSDPRSRRRIRFAQARSAGVILILIVLLGLMVYNTVASGEPWSTRTKDVKLLMTLLSMLLGLDVVLGNRREAARLLGEILMSYSKTQRQSSRETDDGDSDEGR